MTDDQAIQTICISLALCYFFLSVTTSDQLTSYFSQSFFRQITTNHKLSTCTRLSVLFHFFIDDQTITIFDSANIFAWYSSSLTSHIHLTIAASFLPILVTFFSLTDQDTLPNSKAYQTQPSFQVNSVNKRHCYQLHVHKLFPYRRAFLQINQALFYLRLFLRVTNRQDRY